MKRILASCLALVILILSCSFAFTEQTGESYPVAITVKKNVNLRAQATKASKSLKKLPKGEKVVVLSEEHAGNHWDEWYPMMDADRAVAAALDTLSGETTETGESWLALYRAFISSGSYRPHISAKDPEYNDMLLERDFAYDRVAFHDFEGDGIPELLIATSYGIEQIDVFGIKSGNVEHMGVIGGDNFINNVFFFNDLSYPWLFTSMGGPAQSIEAWWIEQRNINNRSIASTIVNSEGDETIGISMLIQDDKLEKMLWAAVADSNTLMAKELRWFSRSELSTEENWTKLFSSATKFN